DYLSRPTVSLTVRTHDNARNEQYQREYFPWDVALATDPAAVEQELHLLRCLRLYEFYQQNGDAKARDRFAWATAETLNPYEAFRFAVQYWQDLLINDGPDPERLIQLLNRVGSIDRRFVPRIARSIEASGIYFISILALDNEQDRLICA